MINHLASSTEYFQMPGLYGGPAGKAIYFLSGAGGKCACSRGWMRFLPRRKTKGNSFTNAVQEYTLKPRVVTLPTLSLLAAARDNKVGIVIPPHTNSWHEENKIGTTNPCTYWMEYIFMIICPYSAVWVNFPWKYKDHLRTKRFIVMGHLPFSFDSFICLKSIWCHHIRIVLDVHQWPRHQSG